jgi:hypothetical protein
MRFSDAKNIRVADIHRQSVEVYSEGAMNGGSVRKCRRLFRDSRTDLHDEKGSGHPSLVAELKKKANEKTQENRQFTIYELHKYFPDVSRSEIHEIVPDWLKCLAANFFD